MRLNRSFALLFVGGLASAASAVPYASSVRNTSGTDWEFVLNMSAENVTILRDGNPLDMGGLAAGRYTFSMAGFTNWDITVTQETPIARWATVSDTANTFTHYEHPTGIAVNRDPSDEFFGVVYVANAQTLAVSVGSTRPMGDGIYSLTADMKGVNLDAASQDYDYFGQTFDFDTAQAKAPAGWTVSGSSASPWRMSLDDAGNLIVADFSDANGGIKYASRDLTSGGLVLGVQGGPFGGVISPTTGERFHGSIASAPYTTGTVGVDLTVWALDEDLRRDRQAAISGDNGLNVWRWDAGSQTDYDGNPVRVIDTQNIPATTDSRSNWVAQNVGIVSDAYYDPTFDKWYMVHNRADGNQSGLVIVTPGGVDGSSPALHWSSLQFSIDNTLDGHTGLAGIQDIFRHMGGGISISEDGTELYLHRVNTSSTNPFFGTTSTNPALRGAVLVIPLDGNGIPDIEVNAGALMNVESITTVGNNANATRRPLALDAAGNVYIGNNNQEKLQVFSPGGSWIATTSSDGTFSLVPFGVATPGDHDGNGVVDARDYVVWRKNPAAFGNAQGYTDWVANFGTGTEGGGGDAVGAVPEPSSLALVMLGLLGVGAQQRRSRKK